MPFIHLTTFIAAPPERVFDLSRHVSLHKQSMARNREEIIAGVRSGMMNKGDSVTWQAKHLFKKKNTPGRTDRNEKARIFCG